LTGNQDAGVDVEADRAIMAFIRESRRAHDLPRVGAFALLFTAATRLRFLNYAIPDDGADPDDSEVQALVKAFEMAERVPPVEFLPSVAPALESRLIARDAGSRTMVGAAQSGAPAGGATEIVGVVVSPSHRRRGLAAAMVSALAGQGLEAGLETVFLEAAPGADGAYRNAGFLRTSTSVHLSFGA
jgi:ribosomal protein S18 acetylase RimI-like enzyme